MSDFSNDEQVDMTDWPPEKRAEFLKTVAESWAQHPTNLEEALERLFKLACGGSGGSQAARAFLFWLGGEPDPTGYVSHGGLELHRFDGFNRSAALIIFYWWVTGSTADTSGDAPLYEVLDKLRRHWEPEHDPDFDDECAERIKQGVADRLEREGP